MTSLDFSYKRCEQLLKKFCLESMSCIPFNQPCDGCGPWEKLCAPRGSCLQYYAPCENGTAAGCATCAADTALRDFADSTSSSQDDFNKLLCYLLLPLAALAFLLVVCYKFYKNQTRHQQQCIETQWTAHSNVMTTTVNFSGTRMHPVPLPAAALPPPPYPPLSSAPAAFPPDFTSTLTSSRPTDVVTYSFAPQYSLTAPSPPPPAPTYTATYTPAGGGPRLVASPTPAVALEFGLPPVDHMPPPSYEEVIKEHN